MTPDRDFENQLFALYGDAAAEWADDGVTDRVLREIDRQTRMRRTVILSAAAIGVALSMTLLALLAGPQIARAAATVGTSPLVLWLAMFAGAASLGWTTARLTSDA